MFVKICGLTTREALDAAVEAGADAVGFVFADSVREVSPERAAELAAGSSTPPLKVAVMRQPSRTRFEHVLATFTPDWIQTDAEDLSSARAARRRRGIAGLP